MRQYDVLSICNALVDVLVEIDETSLRHLNIEKGIMHLVDSSRQKAILDHFSNHDLNIELGGSALNATRTLAALGSKTFFVGMIGKDQFGQRIKDRMGQLGISSHVSETTESTGSCAVLITPDGERTMNTCLGASAMYNESHVPHEEIKVAKILHFTGYQWSTPHQRKAIVSAMKTAKEFGTLVSFDVADPGVVAAFKNEFVETIEQYADIVFANEKEAQNLFDLDAVEAGRKISRMNITAAIKLGAKGAFIAGNNEEHMISPVKTSVIDTTAAGDMFAAGFLYGMSNDRGLRVSGEIAALLASDVISRVGATVDPSAIDKAKIL